MDLLTIVTQVFGASMLLLFGVRTVRTGIERAFGAGLKRMLNQAGNPLRGAASGFVLAVVLQGATAVILLSSGLVATGAIPLASGLALALGADVGSAVVIRVLTFDVSWLAPVLLSVGGWTFLNAQQSRRKNLGRALLGIALILVSLQMISTAVSPLKEAEALPYAARYLANDLVLAFLIGAGFTFLVHSSVAAILVCVTLVAAGSLSFAAGVAFVLGANLGSTLIALWLVRGDDPAVRQLPVLNGVLRGVAAIIALLSFQLLQGLVSLGFWPGNASGVILAHLAFNTALLGLLPFTRPLAAVAERMLPAQPRHGLAAEAVQFSGSAMAASLGTARALSVVRRDVLSMLEQVSAMLAHCGTLMDKPDELTRKAIRDLDSRQSQHLQGLRRYFAALPAEEVPKADMRLMRSYLEYAVKLKHSGEIITRRILPVPRDMQAAGLAFSERGRAELVDLQQRALANTYLAFEVLSTGSTEQARTLVAEKEAMTRAEQTSRNRHFKRLSGGNAISFETSDLHLEISAALKEVNSKVATIAYILLSPHGQLSDSRLMGGSDNSDQPE